MSTGKEVKAAFAKASAWGAPVAMTSGDAFYLLTENLSLNREHLPDDSAGQAFHAARDLGLITCTGEVSAYLRYQGLERLLAMAMGQAGAPAANGDSGQDHSLRLADDTDGLFGTLAVLKGHSVHQFPSVKVDGFTITGQAGQPVTASFSLVADTRDLVTGSGVNTLTLMTSLAEPTLGNRLLFRQAEVLLNDAADGALSAGDAIAPSSFTLTFRRNLAGDHLAGGGDKIAEPVAAGFPELSLSLEFPTYTTDTYLADLGQDARKKISIAFTGGEIEAGVNHAMTFLMPHAVITNAQAAVDRAGKIAHPVTLSLLAAASAPAGMDGVTGPLAIDITNTNPADPLA